MSTDPRIDAYIAASADFAQPILSHLRALIHTTCPEAEETIRWRMPSFSYHGRPLGHFAAFKRHVALGFWNEQALATRQAGAMGQFGRIEAMSDVPKDEVIIAMVRASMGMIDTGEAPRHATRGAKPEAVVPPELAEALAGDPVAEATFRAFSASCRREYCEWIEEAKRPETKARRVAETIGWLRAGKRRNWKYENC